MIHLRITCPAVLSERVVELLDGEDDVHNVVFAPGVVRKPEGDAFQCDVRRRSANRLLGVLADLGVSDRGSIVLENVDTAVGLPEPIGRFGARYREFEPVWPQVEARIVEAGTYPPSWFLLMVIAGTIGGVGVLTNSQILIVGAMVVGPEYGAMIAMAWGITRRDRTRVLDAAIALVLGFALAIASAFALGLLIRALGQTPPAFEAGVRPVSQLIDSPNVFSFIVALVAGIVGVVSLTTARASTLIGVFISVTTIPAAADLGLSGAYGNWSDADGSFFQLLMNVVVLTVVGVIVLLVQRRAWGGLHRR